MKITDIADSHTQITDFENFFNIYEDNRNNYSYNLNETIYLDIDESQLQDYVCKCECFWPLISYKLYDTTRLAWLLMKVNKVKGNEIFDKKYPGDVIKYLPIEIVNSIVGSINVS